MEALMYRAYYLTHAQLRCSLTCPETLGPAAGCKATSIHASLQPPLLSGGKDESAMQGYRAPTSPHWLCMHHLCDAGASLCVCTMMGGPMPPSPSALYTSVHREPSSLLLTTLWRPKSCSNQPSSLFSPYLWAWLMAQAAGAAEGSQANGFSSAPTTGNTFWALINTGTNALSGASQKSMML